LRVTAGLYPHASDFQIFRKSLRVLGQITHRCASGAEFALRGSMARDKHPEGMTLKSTRQSGNGDPE
jgi:hypothetical protein